MKYKGRGADHRPGSDASGLKLAMKAQAAEFGSLKSANIAKLKIEIFAGAPCCETDKPPHLL